MQFNELLILQLYFGRPYIPLILDPDHINSGWMTLNVDDKFSGSQAVCMEWDGPSQDIVHRNQVIRKIPAGGNFKISGCGIGISF
jgi:hypothetical protein